MAAASASAYCSSQPNVVTIVIMAQLQATHRPTKRVRKEANSASSAACSFAITPASFFFATSSCWSASTCAAKAAMSSSVLLLSWRSPTPLDSPASMAVGPRSAISAFCFDSIAAALSAPKILAARSMPRPLLRAALVATFAIVAAAVAWFAGRRVSLARLPSLVPHEISCMLQKLKMVNMLTKVGSMNRYCGVTKTMAVSSPCSRAEKAYEAKPTMAATTMKKLNLLVTRCHTLRDMANTMIMP
mmetsp:Transcript_29988/g.83710  ORF Transcript_29988/g.83710 Transcript_29988/m.83710 type:complete len:245 (+) Transcript_29988:36-770(+)